MWVWPKNSAFTCGCDVIRSSSATVSVRPPRVGSSRSGLWWTMTRAGLPLRASSAPASHLRFADGPRRDVGLLQRVEDEPVRPRRLDHVRLPVFQRRRDAVLLRQGGAEAVAVVVVAQGEVDRQAGRPRGPEQSEQRGVVFG